MEAALVMNQTGAAATTTVIPSTFAPPSTGGAAFTEIYSKLLPVLAQCFSIVAIGFISGKTRLVPQSETKGLQSVVTYFFLPALIFRSLATIDLYSVNYKFLASILIGKLAVFVSVGLLTWLLKRKNRISYAGLFAVFCTQSNDFALGYPLVSYLYEKDHPEFSHYLYLIAPIQLMIMNPIGFILMEYGRISNDQRPRQCKQSPLLHIKRTLCGIIVNPIIMMTGAGLVVNFALKQHLPPFLETVIEPLSSAFTACALFLLGQNMVGGFNNMCKYTFLTTVLIVSVKILASPLIIREVVSHMGIEDAAYTDFGFLYGMLPPAPTVAIFAAQFCLPNDAVSAGVVAGTFASAPLIFITATMSRISDSTQSYEQTMTTAISYTSAITIPFCIWTLFVLLPKRKRITHSTTMWLLLAQTVTCIGGVMIFWVKEDGSPFFYIHTLVSLAGIFSSRVWTAVIAMVLMLAHERSLCFALKIRSTLIICGLAASMMATIILTAGIPFGSHQILRNNPNFHLGRIQAGVSLIILIVSFTVTAYGLVRQQRYRTREEYEPLFISDDETQENTTTSVVATNATVDIPSTSGTSSGCMGCACGKNNDMEDEIPDLEDLGKPKFVKRKTPRVRRLSEKGNSQAPVPLPMPTNDPTFCGPAYRCTTTERKSCVTQVKHYLNQVHPGEEVTEPSVDLHQTFRHVCLLILLLFSMMIGMAVSLWQLLTEKPTGILLELEFLDIVLNYGQGILTFVVFGADASWMMFPFRALWDYVFRNTIHLPAYCELSLEIKNQCEQFRVYHMEIFATDVWPGIELENVRFSGQQMCDWLCLVGLARSRDEAVTYGRSLIEGRTISHVLNTKHFEDDVHLYQFLSYPTCAALERPQPQPNMV